MDPFFSAQSYLTSGRFTPVENVWFFEDRNQLRGRLPGWYKQMESWTGNENQAALLSSLLGELANNAFDHNLGMWTGPPGCLVGLSIRSKTICVSVADRGQGIISSLRKQLPAGTSPDEVMRIAFEERVSGRAPEQRGNGLKFVRNGVDGRRQRLYCFSGNTVYGKGNLIFKINRKSLENSPGTLSVIEWDLS